MFGKKMTRARPFGLTPQEQALYLMRHLRVIRPDEPALRPLREPRRIERLM